MPTKQNRNLNKKTLEQSEKKKEKSEQEKNSSKTECIDILIKHILSRLEKNA